MISRTAATLLICCIVLIGSMAVGTKLTSLPVRGQVAFWVGLLCVAVALSLVLWRPA